MTENTSPFWPNAPCPTWCARDHRDDDHPDDRYHASEPAYVAALAAVEPTIPVNEPLTALDLVVGIGQYVDDPAAWLAIEAAEDTAPRLVLTVESARFVSRALTAQLARYDGLEPTPTR